ncbi:MAG: response regulator [Candidatus Omnitrophica bacterium]|nr:response regulator [Candidatus Omnitrophota bacterium]
MLQILIIDDEREIVRAMADFFSGKGYRVFTANDGVTALDIVEKKRPHLVFCDIRMPQMDGLQVLRRIRDIDRSIKVIMVTAFGTQEIIGEATRLGAVDFIRKPFTHDYLEQEVIKKVNVQLFEELRREIEEKDQLIEQLRMLHERVSRHFYQTVLSLAAALEARDRYTHGHSERVDFYSKMIAEELHRRCMPGINALFFDNLHIESRLHDIGKIAVPDEVLNKPGHLTPQEYDAIKRHPAESVRILAPLEGSKEHMEVIYSHHERVDGNGYPDAKAESTIPLRAKIIAVADAFDAMTSDRPYRAALPVEKAFGELSHGKGVQFDDAIVDAFVCAYDQYQERLAREREMLKEKMMVEVSVD